MQSLSLSFRAFLIAVLIHSLIVGMILLSQYDMKYKNERDKEPKIVIRLADTLIPSPTFQPPQSQPLQQPIAKPSPFLKIPIQPLPKPNESHLNEPNIQEEISPPIIPMGRVAHLIERHYGEIFDELTPNEQAYIIDNIITIHRIDRRIGNALLAEKAPNQFQDGDSNFVEMYLYPDGSVSDITIIDEKSHKALDELTMETVEKSYAHYPRPNQKTLIRLHTRIQRGR